MALYWLRDRQVGEWNRQETLERGLWTYADFDISKCGIIMVGTGVERINYSIMRKLVVKNPNSTAGPTCPRKPPVTIDISSSNTSSCLNPSIHSVRAWLWCGLHWAQYSRKHNGCGAQVLPYQTHGGYMPLPSLSDSDKAPSSI